MFTTTSTLPAPRVVLIDWHGTLVDTMDAMYHAVDEMLPLIREQGLFERFTRPAQSRTEEDAKLVDYVRAHGKLHPKIPAAKQVSRTDIFEVLFGADEEAKHLAHEAFNRCYRHHYGEVQPFEPGIREILLELRRLGVALGIPTNRNREFLNHELDQVEGGRWRELFDVIVCGDDVRWRKPSPECLLLALDRLGLEPDTDVWYVGDSTTDTVAAKRAGLSNVFFNGAGWAPTWLAKVFPGTPEHPHSPDAVVRDFGELLALVRGRLRPRKSRAAPRATSLPVLPRPKVVLFDWHATLVDTLDAMYRAVDDMLPKLEALGLAGRLIDPAESKTIDDARLVEYVRDYRQLHPKVRAAGKVSRTDIFEILFGADAEAKRIAHAEFNNCYRNHYGSVLPLEDGIRDMLQRLRDLGLQLGVLSNRDREFLEHELSVVEGTGWSDLFDTLVCGDDTSARKPAPDPILKALENLGAPATPHAWYVGDSTTDTVSAKEARIVSVFYNGAGWDDVWLGKIFPGTRRHPHKPDAVVNDFNEFLDVVRLSIEQDHHMRW